MADIYTYLVPLPHGVREMVTPCADDSYTVYINDRISPEEMLEAYNHALRHICNKDFENETDIQTLETDSHSLSS